MSIRPATIARLAAPLLLVLAALYVGPELGSTLTLLLAAVGVLAFVGLRYRPPER